MTVGTPLNLQSARPLQRNEKTVQFLFEKVERFSRIVLCPQLTKLPTRNVIGCSNQSGLEKLLFLLPIIHKSIPRNSTASAEVSDMISSIKNFTLFNCSNI